MTIQSQTSKNGLKELLYALHQDTNVAKRLEPATKLWQQVLYPPRAADGSSADTVLVWKNEGDKVTFGISSDRVSGMYTRIESFQANYNLDNGIFTRGNGREITDDFPNLTATKLKKAIGRYFKQLYK